MIKAIITGGIASVFLVGCCCKNLDNNCSNNMCNNSNTAISTQTNTNTSKNKVCFIQNGMNNSCILRLEASGVGVVPSDVESISQAKAMARRAAIVDAYRNLAEKLYGIKVNGRDTVKNMILQSSTVRSYVSGLIRGASIEDEEYKDGTYRVVLYLKLDPNRWNQVLSHSGLL